MVARRLHGGRCCAGREFRDAAGRPGLPAGTRAAAGQANDPKREDWLPLFNGRNLDGWTPKFTKHPLGENLNDTVRVEDGLLKIRYDKWTAFNGEFGHLFYKTPFSYYRLVTEYRFVGEQVKGGPAGRSGTTA